MTSILSNVQKFFTNEVIGEIQLVGCIILFGIAFVGMRQGMVIDSSAPLTFNACRYVISTFLLLLIKLFSTKNDKSVKDGFELIDCEMDAPVENNNTQRNKWKDILFWGSLCGLANYGGSVTQQIGLVTVTAGKTGFIVGMYVVFVPIAEWVLSGFGDTLTVKALVASLVSLFGLYLLSGCAEAEVCFGGAVKSGELFDFASMFCWAALILIAETGIKYVDPITLTLTNFSFAMVLSIATAIVFEPAQCAYPFTAITGNTTMIVVVSLSETGAILGQAIGQKYVLPTRASLLLSLESVSAAFFGYFILNELLSLIELLGCALMLASAVFSSTVHKHTDQTESDAIGSSDCGDVGGGDMKENGDKMRNSCGYSVLRSDNSNNSEWDSEKQPLTVEHGRLLNSNNNNNSNYCSIEMVNNN